MTARHHGRQKSETKLLESETKLPAASMLELPRQRHRETTALRCRRGEGLRREPARDRGHLRRPCRGCRRLRTRQPAEDLRQCYARPLVWQERDHREAGWLPHDARAGWLPPLM